MLVTPYELPLIRVSDLILQQPSTKGKTKSGRLPAFFHISQNDFFTQIFDTGAELVRIFARISLFGNLSSIF